MLIESSGQPVPVLTEAAWLLRSHPAAIDRLLRSLTAGFLRLLPLDSADAEAIAGVLRQYRTIRPQLADAALVRRCLEKRPGDRFTSARDLGRVMGWLSPRTRAMGSLRDLFARRKDGSEDVTWFDPLEIAQGQLVKLALPGGNRYGALDALRGHVPSPGA